MTTHISTESPKTTLPHSIDPLGDGARDANSACGTECLIVDSNSVDTMAEARCSPQAPEQVIGGAQWQNGQKIIILHGLDTQVDRSIPTSGNKQVGLILP